MEPVTRTIRGSSLLLALGLAAGLGLAGCNLFQPRVPQPPTQSGVLSSYVEPDSTLATLGRAIMAKGGSNSLSVYLGGLADSVTVGDPMDFLAFFDPDAAAAWQIVSGRALPAAWNRALEERLITYLASLSASHYNFYWQTDIQHPNDEELGLNLRLLHRQYVLATVPAASAAPDTLSIGYADLTFLKSTTTGKWVIARWQDRVDPTVGANPIKGKQSFSALRLEQY